MVNIWLYLIIKIMIFKTRQKKRKKLFWKEGRLCMTMQFSHCWCTSNYNWTGGLALMS